MMSEWERLIQEKEKEIERLKRELKIWKQKATLDDMTGVNSKSEGFKRLKQDMDSCVPLLDHLTVAFIDVDQLKIVNDKCGHHAGDELIIEVTHLLKENIRKKDYIFRFGGDEFIIVFPHTALKDAKKIWKRIQKVIDEANRIRKGLYSISLSIGFYEYGKEKDLTVEEVICLADKQMYEEKKNK